MSPTLIRASIVAMAFGGAMAVGSGTAHADSTDPLSSLTSTVSGLVGGVLGSPGTSTPASGSSSTPSGECHCNLTLGTPKVAGKNAATIGSATVPASQPATLTLPVSNTGDATVTDLRVSGTALDCGTTSLAAGASTTCTGSITPALGEHSGTLHVTGTTPDGNAIAADVTWHATGVVNDTTSTSGSGSGGSGSGGSGTTGTTGTAGTTGTSTTAGQCHCNLTIGTPQVGGKNAGGSGSATAPAGQAATVSLPVTNTGDVEVTGIKVTGPQGALTGGTTSLAPGESTTFTGSITPAAGEQSGTLHVSGVLPDGQLVTADATWHLLGSNPTGGTTGTTGTSPAGGTTGTTGSNPTGGTTGTTGGTTSTTGLPLLGSLANLPLVGSLTGGTTGSNPTGGTTGTNPTGGTTGTTGTNPTGGTTATTGGTTSTTGLPLLGSLANLPLVGSLTGSTGSSPLSILSSLTGSPSGDPISGLLSGLLGAGTSPDNRNGTPSGQAGSTTTGGTAGTISGTGTDTTGSTTGTTGTTSTTGTTGASPGSTTSSGSTSTGSTAPHVLAMSTPTVNGQSAGDAGTAPTVTSGMPANIAVAVSNTSTAPVTGLQVRAPGGARMACGTTTLAPGQYTICAGRFVPTNGVNRGLVVATGTTNGQTFRSTVPVFARGVPVGSDVVPAVYTPHVTTGLTTGVTGVAPTAVGLGTGVTSGIPALGSVAAPGGLTGPYGVPTGAVAAGGGGGQHRAGPRSPAMPLLILAGLGALLAGAASRMRRRSS